MENLIKFPIHPEISQEFIDQTDKLEEQNTEIYHLIGYMNPPGLKLIEGGLDSCSEYCFQKEDYP